ncbi:MAG TPA: molybdopterin cofactor-binding domain-containing protein, partial [Caulobacteraceae bacterium]|nr:molybdopterin cofactor-binding domain-containing protein [Caulobacteraceae bacterium]
SGERTITNDQGMVVLETLRRETGWGRQTLPTNHGRGIAIRCSHIGQGKTEIALKLLEDGHIELLYGTPDQGAGSLTVVRRVAAAALSVKPERIIVRYGTTAEAPFDAEGAGASRVTHVAGRATAAGAARLKERLEQLAAEFMGWPEGKVRLEDDRFCVDGGEEPASFEQVAERITRGGRQVTAKGAYDSSVDMGEDPLPFCGYVIEVRVDPESGCVEIVDVVMAADVGTVINPIAHQGQLEGAFVFGLSSAMMEELTLEDGRPTVSNLNDYKLPTLPDVPRLRTILVPAESGPGPFGAKSVGELANGGVAPAIANAVYAATDGQVRTLPITAERVRAAMREAASH